MRQLLSLQTKKSLGIGLVITLTITLPIFIWGLVTQKALFLQKAQQACGGIGCFAQGTCHPGTQNNYCGGGGNACVICSSGRVCDSNGNCVCGGCLDSQGICHPGTELTSCGLSGTTCMNCTTQGADVACINGACVTTGTPPIVCDGCLNSQGVCQHGGDNDYCGTNGAQCVNCSLQNKFCCLDKICKECCTDSQCPPDKECEAGTCVSPGPTPQAFKFKVKFMGVDGAGAEGALLQIRFVGGGVDKTSNTFPIVYEGGGIYLASIVLPEGGLPEQAGYTIYIKGEKHLSRKFCQDNQTSRCTGAGSIKIEASAPENPQTFNFSGLPLEPGDLYQQDGVADSNDFNKIINLFSKACSQLSTQEKLTADLDYNGCVNVMDAFLMRKTLETKYDEE